MPDHARGPRPHISVDGVKVLWYFPFARPEELPLACATAAPGDRITIQVVDRSGAPSRSPCPPVTLVGDLPDVTRDDRNRVTWALSRWRTYRQRARRRRRLFEELDPDLVHVHYVNRFTDWWSLRRVPRNKLVVSVHDIDPHVTRLPAALEHRLHQWTFDRAGAIVVHHDHLRDDLLRRFRLPADLVHVIPHQVFQYERSVVAALPSEPNVLLFGAMRSNKGIPTLLDALAELPPATRVVIAGRGDADLETAVRHRASVDARVHAEIGFVTQERKSELFKAASLVVLPYTDFSSQSGVLHDAYAHGRPVIVTDVGALGDTVREDETGVVVSPGDPTALAEAIRTLSADPRAMETMHRNAVAVSQARSPSRIGPMLRAVYEAL